MHQKSEPKRDKKSQFNRQKRHSSIDAEEPRSEFQFEANLYSEQEDANWNRLIKLNKFTFAKENEINRCYAIFYTETIEECSAKLENPVGERCPARHIDAKEHKYVSGISLAIIVNRQMNSFGFPGGKRDTCGEGRMRGKRQHEDPNDTLAGECLEELGYDPFSNTNDFTQQMDHTMMLQYNTIVETTKLYFFKMKSQKTLGNIDFSRNKEIKDMQWKTIDELIIDIMRKNSSFKIGIHFILQFKIIVDVLAEFLSSKLRDNGINTTRSKFDNIITTEYLAKLKYQENQLFLDLIIGDMKQIRQNLKKYFLKTSQLPVVEKSFDDRIKALELINVDKMIPGQGGSLLFWTLQLTRLSYDDHFILSFNDNKDLPILCNFIHFFIEINKDLELYARGQRVAKVNNVPVSLFFRKFLEFKGYLARDTYIHTIVRYFDIYNHYNPIHSLEFENGKKLVVEYNYFVRPSNSRYQAWFVYPKQQQDEGQPPVEPLRLNTTRMYEYYNLFYMRLQTFSEDHKVMNQQVQDLQNGLKAAKIVIDVRGNTGGMVSYLQRLLLILGINRQDMESRHLNSDEAFRGQINQFTGLSAIQYFIDTKLQYVDQIEYIEQRPNFNETIKKSRAVYKGKLIIVTDTTCFSACIHFVNLVKIYYPNTLILGRDVSATGGQGNMVHVPLKSGYAKIGFGTMQIESENVTYIGKELMATKKIPEKILYDDETLLHYLFSII